MDGPPRPAAATYEEEIAVKDAPPEQVVCALSQGRPVFGLDPGRRRAVALAAVSMLPGALMCFAMIAINLAQAASGPIGQQ